MKTLLMSSVIAVSAIAACQAAPTASAAPHHQEMTAMINVSGTGTTSRAPDTASVSAGVVTQGKTAGEAMRANAVKMNAAFKALKDAGVLEKNIQTSQLSLSPSYNYENNRRSPTIDGYEVRNTVSAKTDDLNGVGPMLDALVTAGVNNINGVNFSIKDPKAAQSEARIEAIKDARMKAAEMAKAAGVTLGPLLSLSENSSGGFQPPQPMYARAEAMDSSAPTPISAGEQSMSVTVNMSYKIIE